MARVLHGRIGASVMAIGTQKVPQTYASLGEAQAAASAANTLVWALVSGVMYRVYPKGKTTQVQ